MRNLAEVPALAMTPVVILTGLSAVRAAALGSQVFAVLRKPCDEETLHHVLQRALDPFRELADAW